MDESLEPATKARRSGKDTVFSDLFRDLRNSCELARAVHPELSINESDIKILSLHSVLLARPYNDLGLLVKNRLLIFVEAQSTWSPNVLVRILLYLAMTWHDLIRKNKYNVYGSRKIPLPQPEFYVIYTGSRRNCPQTLSLADEFFPETAAIDLQVHVLTEPTPESIIGQYIRFCHVFDQQVKLHGATRQAVEETIRICRDENVLRDYLEERKQEVVTIMMTLFSQEEVMDAYGEDCRRAGHEEGHREGREEGHREGREEGLESAAMNMLRDSMSIANIMKFTHLPEERILELAKNM